jgi:hypothetical protein
MQGIYEELYTFLLAENVEETKVYCFKDWLTWYIENNLYHIQKNQDGSIEKVVFIRRLNSNDIAEFPEYLHPEIPNVDKITKYNLHRPDGNIFYCELLVDKIEKVDDLKIENMKFAFEWAKNRFNITTDQLSPADILLYYKKGHKAKITLRDMSTLIDKILNYSS